jgi:DnaK suppressor protein
MTCYAARRLGEFERRLRRERRDAYHALVTTDAELASCEGERAGDLLDDAARDTACRVLASREEHDRRVLAEISAAERRLSAGSFGVCETCARPISVERLRALPMARLCVVCEAMAERVAHG